MREQKDRYEIFLKVYETGSFSKAAEALNYTQSGISQMMAGLEEELGVQLFARINRGGGADGQRTAAAALYPGAGQSKGSPSAGGL